MQKTEQGITISLGPVDSLNKKKNFKYRSSLNETMIIFKPVNVRSPTDWSRVRRWVNKSLCGGEWGDAQLGHILAGHIQSITYNAKIN